MWEFGQSGPKAPWTRKLATFQPRGKLLRGDLPLDYHAVEQCDLFVNPLVSVI